MASRAERSLSFGAVACDYDRLRPPPPPEAVDWLLPPRRDVVVDLAAGTGLLTRALAGKAGRVIAVEPDERMRSVLRARSAGVCVLAGRGECIPLPDASADAVLVSSAWQWMDPVKAVPEIARVLRDGGRFGLIWTGRDPGIEWLNAGEWFREAHAELRGGPGHQELRPPDPEFFGDTEMTTFRFSRYMRVTDIVGLIATYSRVIMASPQARQAGRERAAAALAAQFPGVAGLAVPMLSHCWRADRAARRRAP